MFILNTFSLTQWYKKYTVNSLEFIIPASLKNHEEDRAKEVEYKEFGEWMGGYHNYSSLNVMN